VRVLVVTTAGTGHILPTLPVALALRAAGHDVGWATAPESHAVVERHGFATSAVGMGLRDRHERFGRSYGHAFTLPPPERRPVMFAGLFADIAAPRATEELEPLLAEQRPDLVVHEVAEMASPPLTAAYGIPRITVAFSGELPEAVRAPAVDAVQPLWSRHGLEAPPDLGLHDLAYLHPFAPSLGQRPAHPSVVDVAPAPTETAPLPVHLGDLGRDRPLVYVTFGTELGALAPWEPVLSALASLDVDVLATVGGTVDPGSIPRPPPGAGALHIERYVPHAAVLDRAALVVSHGGAGTVIAAGAAAVPQLMIPLGADQFENAGAFTGAGVARRAASTATAAELAAHAEALLSDAEVRSRSDSLATEFRTMPDVGGTLEHLLR
jgi:UDP:flavonoid glycosyltransferase YjiC (YdhE family)